MAENEFVAVAPPMLVKVSWSLGKPVKVVLDVDMTFGSAIKVVSSGCKEDVVLST